ncbi:MAG: hypothetical protein HY511_09995 [Actinobacteria bacterium]|nr:hypothetical protein [Actinomycetota bacterium]
MKRLISVVVAGCATLAFAAGASAIDFGANDDTGKFKEGGEQSTFFQQMKDANLKINVMSAKFNPAAPTTITDKTFLDRAIPAARAKGLKVVLAIFPTKAKAAAEGATAAQFAEYVAQVARAYPQVKEFVIGNEPNQPRFWQPQFNADGTQASAAAFGEWLAAAYDALKAIDGGIVVSGIGLSPRGNDRPGAASNVSTSPVRFLKALGDWYRGSGRTKPLMDKISFHPYPNKNSDALLKGYQWPGIGVPNVDRLKQALWDAFNGTGQPHAESGLEGDADEAGWQVSTEGKPGYTGAENVPVTNEENQAKIYDELVRYIVCDAFVRTLNFFGYYDDQLRDAGFQAGLRWLDGSARAANQAVQDAITETGGACKGTPRSWKHATTVIGAKADFGKLGSKSKKQKAWNFKAYAEEDANYKAGVFAARTKAEQIGRELASVRAPVLSATGLVKAYFTPLVKLPKQSLAPGSYVYAIRLTAWANPARASVFVSKPFTVK